MEQKILLTGGNGFIGKNLYEILSKNYVIYKPNRKELNLLDSENVLSYLKENRFDIVIHTAKWSEKNSRNLIGYDSDNENLRMFFNLEKGTRYYGKMYYFGSGAEYDSTHYIPFMDEDYFGRHIPKDMYGFAKYIMSKTCSVSKNIYDLRLFGVFGKYEEWNRRFISNAICSALLKRHITIRKNVFFDYIWVNDLAEIMKWFIHNEPLYKHYNVCSGKKIDLYSLALIIRNTLGFDCRINVSEEGLKTEYTGSNQRLLNEISEIQFTPFEISIKSMIDYYKENIDKIHLEVC